MNDVPLAEQRSPVEDGNVTSANSPENLGLTPAGSTMKPPLLHSSTPDAGSAKISPRGADGGRALRKYIAGLYPTFQPDDAVESCR
ncbi:hypothetical protein E2C01_050088 [Portunus trituberculatus]|uniref:Uncharacterized protein n=1 Tax=Portunus trituberculatus TaxID=210409 RepID=A0A5B7GFJ6_PORTR|nr:hypothetical protein [Portunus trituberculatus]